MMEHEILVTIAAWGAAIAGLAAGAKGFSYLVRSGVWGFRSLKKAAHGVARLAAIGGVDAWPNGSEDLPSFLQATYATVQKLLKYHEAEFWGTEVGLRDARWPEGPNP